MRPKAMLILGVLALAFCAFAEVELFPFETFDTWTTPADPPTGWTRIVGGDEATPADNTNDWHPHAGDGTWTTSPVARILWTPQEDWDDWLITPSFDATGATYDSVVFEYETDYNRFAVGARDNVVVLSLDGGTTWPETLWAYGISNSSIHETRRIDITSLVDGFTNCRIAFWAHRTSWNDNHWEIDNVVVYGYEAATEPAPPTFAFACEPSLPAGTTNYTFDVNIDDATGVVPTSVELCYSINDAPETCVGMTYVTGAPDGIGDYTYTLSGLRDWDQIEYYYRATDTFVPASTGTSATCMMIVGGQYYIYEDGTGMPMSPDPTWINATSGFRLGAIEADDAVAGYTGLLLHPVFYGIEDSVVWVSSNGWFTFGDAAPSGSHWMNEDIPTPGGLIDGFLAFYWDDLWGSDGQAYYYEDPAGNYVILSFNNWELLWPIGPFNVQVQIWHPDAIPTPGGNSVIDVRFNTLPPVSLHEASMGVENHDGSDGTAYMFTDGSYGSPDYLGLTSPTRTIRYCTTPPPEGGELWGYVTLFGRADHSGATVGIIGTSLTATTAADGYYEIPRIAEGTYNVWCHHPAFFGDTAYGIVIVEESRTRKDFTLYPRPVGSIEGWVKFTDSPGPYDGILCQVIGTELETFTDADGYFFIDDVAVGDNQVVASFPGYNMGWSPMFEVVEAETYTIDDTILLTPIEVEDFEDDDGGLIPTPLTGGWQWGAPTVGPTATHSGVNCWGTMLHDNYLNNASWTLDVEVPFPSIEFSWWHWMNTEMNWDGGNIKVSTDGGATWNIATPLETPYNATISAANPAIGGEEAWSGIRETWEYERIVLTPDVTHVRFHLGSDASVTRTGWYVDDIAFSASPVGQLRVYVYDCNSYATIEGAKVNAPGGSGYTGPDGSVLLDDIQYGSVTISAGAPGYWPKYKDVVVFIDELTTVIIPICPIDIDEITGQLEHDSADSILFELCNPTDDTIWYYFTGIPGGGGVPGRARPERSDDPRRDFTLKNTGDASKLAMSNGPVGDLDSYIARSRPGAVGDVVDSFSIPETNLPWSFGIEGRTEINRVWVTDRHEIGGAITSVQNMAWTTSPWTYTGIVHDIGRIHWPDAAPDMAWFTDMAWDANRNVMWQLESYETFKLYAWDPNTGEIVDSLGGPWATIWQRGVGYDFARDVFYIGGWGVDVIYSVKGPSWDAPGDIMETYDAPGCAGIAFDPGRRTVWYVQSGVPGQIHEIDLATGERTNTILAPHSELGGLGGLDMDYQGRLWVMNFLIPRIYVLEAPASVLPGGMFVEPNAGFIAPGECVVFALVNPEYANPVGDYDFDIYLHTDPNLPVTQLPVSVQVLPDVPKGWNLIAVPIQAIPNDPYIQLRDDIVPFNVNPTGSNIWAWNQDDGIFEMPTGFDRGRGYYLQTWHEQTFFDVYGAPFAPGDFVYSVYYPEASPSHGLWLVGNPFNRRLDWDAVYAATDFTYLEPEYWTWSQKEGYKFYHPTLGGGGEGNIIDSWRGYYINVRPGNPATITNIVYPQEGTMETFMAKVRPKTVKAVTANPEEFTLRLSVSAVNGSDRRNDLYNYLSVNELALDGYCSYDIQKPSFSNPAGAIKAFFEVSGLRLARDTKRNFSLGSKDWTFVVRDLPAGMNVTIRWPKDRVPTHDDMSCGVDNLDSRWSLFLTDQVTGETINMREIYDYSFTSTSGARRFTITLGDSPLDVEERKLPEEFALSANRPNPFNATTEFTVALPKNSHVTVEVFDLLGQKVSTLVDGEMEAGYQRIIWDGRDVQERDVPSGIYLYRVTAGDFRETRKMTLIK
ncbi:MAG TPA: T9SS type A sorting domain-containing protein [candidate division Zixibacteria bacterium]|nr:T9SS type A sorting domain-containing protein [candidate division Zixibacteria bacterium]